MPQLACCIVFDPSKKALTADGPRQILDEMELGNRLSGQRSNKSCSHQTTWTMNPRGQAASTGISRVRGNALRSEKGLKYILGLRDALAFV
jgi:hypothetical protein